MSYLERSPVRRAPAALGCKNVTTEAAGAPVGAGPLGVSIQQPCPEPLSLPYKPSLFEGTAAAVRCRHRPSRVASALSSAGARSSAQPVGPPVGGPAGGWHWAPADTHCSTRKSWLRQDDAAAEDSYSRSLPRPFIASTSPRMRPASAAIVARRHGTGVKRFHHAVVGDLTLAFEGLESTAEPELSFLIYTAEPGSPSEERLRLLASWAAGQPAAGVDSLTAP
ncbi:hypothetical protein ACIRCZ_10130 [Leifsonia sp. NPDC102414]|uniref:MmyB family transcriptional regulator n=1 Tax=Leifsonia sp. NPDC102414 TaxID=3364124 RepID=UPI00382C6811